MNKIPENLFPFIKDVLVQLEGKLPEEIIVQIAQTLLQEAEYQQVRNNTSNSSNDLDEIKAKINTMLSAVQNQNEVATKMTELADHQNVIQTETANIKNQLSQMDNNIAQKFSMYQQENESFSEKLLQVNEKTSAELSKVNDSTETQIQKSKEEILQQVNQCMNNASNQMQQMQNGVQITQKKVDENHTALLDYIERTIAKHLKDWESFKNDAQRLYDLVSKNSINQDIANLQQGNQNLQQVVAQQCNQINIGLQQVVQHITSILDGKVDKEDLAHFQNDMQEKFGKMSFNMDWSYFDNAMKYLLSIVDSKATQADVQALQNTNREILENITKNLEFAQNFSLLHSQLTELKNKQEDSIRQIHIAWDEFYRKYDLEKSDASSLAKISEFLEDKLSPQFQSFKEEFEELQNNNSILSKNLSEIQYIEERVVMQLQPKFQDIAEKLNRYNEDSPESLPESLSNFQIMLDSLKSSMKALQSLNDLPNKLNIPENFASVIENVPYKLNKMSETLTHFREDFTEFSSSLQDLIKSNREQKAEFSKFQATLVPDLDAVQQTSQKFQLKINEMDTNNQLLFSQLKSLLSQLQQEQHDSKEHRIAMLKEYENKMKEIIPTIFSQFNEQFIQNQESFKNSLLENIENKMKEQSEQIQTQIQSQIEKTLLSDSFKTMLKNAIAQTQLEKNETSKQNDIARDQEKNSFFNSPLNTTMRIPQSALSSPEQKVSCECPHCGKEYNVPQSYQGRRVECSQCKNRFVIPSIF